MLVQAKGTRLEPEGAVRVPHIPPIAAGVEEGTGSSRVAPLLLPSQPDGQGLV